MKKPTRQEWGKTLTHKQEQRLPIILCGRKNSATRAEISTERKSANNFGTTSGKMSDKEDRKGESSRMERTPQVFNKSTMGLEYNL